MEATQKKLVWYDCASCGAHFGIPEERAQRQLRRLCADCEADEADAYEDNYAD